MTTQSFRHIADFVPEFVFDFLARIVPGLSFLFLTYFTIFMGTDLTDKTPFPITTIYQFLFILCAGYIVGFLTGLASYWIIELSNLRFNPTAYIIFPKHINTRTSRTLLAAIYDTLFLYRSLSGPLEETVAVQIRDAIQRTFNMEVNRNTVSDIFTLIIGYLKKKEPSLYRVSLKVHAESHMLKNLTFVCVLAIAIEVWVHGLQNAFYIIILLAASYVCYIGFTNLRLLRVKRMFLLFKSIVTVDEGISSD